MRPLWAPRIASNPFSLFGFTRISRAACRRRILSLTARVLSVAAFVLGGGLARPQELVVADQPGVRSSQLVVSLRSEPKTLNPVNAADSSSREILGLIMADLIHINRQSLKTEPALAKSWTVSEDRRQYTLQLRQGLRFSDGEPFDADDVLFTFKVHLDEGVHSAQRDLLIVAGKPIKVEKLDRYTVRFSLAQPYAAAERLFDGFAILPRHLLKRAFEEGRLDQAWSLKTDPDQVAGLGPFVFKKHVPGQQIQLERNPCYWKTDTKGIRLPYFDQVTAVFSGSADADMMRLQGGDVDLVDRLNAADFSAFERPSANAAYRLYDLGPGLEYNFLFFNLNDLAGRNLRSIAAKQGWFEQLKFRQAISAAIDRAAIVRLAYSGRAHPLWAHVPPGNARWVNHSIPPRPDSDLGARSLLRNAGFSWDQEGRLRDPHGEPVVFSILFNAAKLEHEQTATLIQEDLRRLGMDVRVVPLEFHTYLDRVFTSYQYEAAIMSFASSDADPNSDMNVWVSGGSDHVWDLQPKHLPAPWQKEVDDLMERQMTTIDESRRKAMYDRVQELVWKQLPLICLVSPDVLVGASTRLRNFRPSILSSHILWNAEHLYSFSGLNAR